MHTGPATPPPSPFFGHREHNVHFYSDDEVLIDSIEKLIGAELQRGGGAVCFATESHLAALTARFQARDPGIAVATLEGRYLTLDVGDMLGYMSLDNFDEAYILEIVDGAIRNTAASIDSDENSVAVYAELVAQLWAEGHREETVRLERLWNQLAREIPISVRCGYPSEVFHLPDDEEYVQLICCEHCNVISPASSSFPVDASDAPKLLREERQLLENLTRPTYPQWQPEYREAVMENDVLLLFKKLEVAQALVLTRLHELQDQRGHYAEREQLIRAMTILKAIKSHNLGFLE